MTIPTSALADRKVEPTGRDVTVVIPARNRADLIGRALTSVSRQTVAPVATIVVDDGSTDATAEVAAEHAAAVIRLQVSGGSGPARNRGIAAATSEWVAFLDSDDEWDADHLEMALSQAGQHVLVAAPGRRERQVRGNASGRPVALTPLSLLDPGAMVFTSGALVRREALLAAGLFRPLPRAQDLDMWLRVLEHGTGLALGKPTVIYHVHDAQVSLDQRLTRECFDRILADCSERPWFRDGYADRAYTRWKWDELRAGMRRRDLHGTARAGGWLGAHPAVWPTLGRVLRQRWLSRRAAA